MPATPTLAGVIGYPSLAPRRWLARAGRKPILALATVVLGVAAHLIGGDSTDLSCTPLIAAAVIGVLATFTADRLIGYHRRVNAGAVGLVGAGQLAMHLLLGGALPGHINGSGPAGFPPEVVGLGLSCGLVAADAGATAILIILLLGAHRSADMATSLLARARSWLRTHVPVVLVLFADVEPDAERPRTAPAERMVARTVHYGWVRPRRGPPLPAR